MNNPELRSEAFEFNLVLCPGYHELVDEHGDKTVHCVNLEALSMKVNGKWRVVMEYQKSTGNYEQWASLDVLE